MADPAPSNHRGTLLFRFSAWALSGLVVVALLLAGGLAVLSSTPMSAPDWLRDRITQEINARLDTASIEVGDVSLQLGDRLMPRIGLRHVLVSNAGGEQVLQIGDVQSTVALGALMQGEVQPVSLDFSGVQLRVRRFESGSVGLTVGAGESTTTNVGEYGGGRLGVHDAMGEADAWLNHPQFENLTLVALRNATLRYEDERAGRVWTADGARLELTRSGDDLRLRADAALLGGGAEAVTVEMNYSRRIGETNSELGFSFQDMPARDIAGQSPALAWLSELDAPISGSVRAEVDDTGALGPLHATLQIGQGALRPESGAKHIGFTSARTYFTYRPDDQKIEFSEVSIDSDWAQLDALGSVSLEGMETGWPTAFMGQFEMTRIVTNPLDLYPESISLPRAELEMDVRLDPLVLDVGALRLFDQDEVLTIKAQARAEQDGWQVEVAADMPRIAPDRLLELWPGALAPKARKWIDTNVIHTELSDIRFNLDALPGEEASVFLGFGFSDFNARFMRDVPPIQAAHGTASLENNRFVIAATGGHITTDQGGQIDIAGTRFIIPKTNVKRTPAEVDLAAVAPITAALSFLDERPFGYISRAGLPIDLAQGRAEVAGRLNFRMVDKLSVRDVKFELAGALTDVVTDQLLEGRVLRTPELDLEASHEGLRLEGSGQVGDVPFDGLYTMAFGPDPDPETAMGMVRGDIELSDRFLDEFGITLPPGSFSGQGRAAVEIDLARDRPAALRLSSELAGIALRVDALIWSMSSDATGLMQVTGRLGRPPEIDLIALEAPGLQAEGTLSLTGDGVLERALFERVQAGNWLDARVELVGRGRAVPPLVRVLGGQVDLRQASLASGNGGGEGGPLSLQLDRLIVAETLALTDFRAEIATGGGASGPFSGWLNGQDKITGQMIPRDGGTAFQVRSENAGTFFAALGLIKQARNGAVDLSLVPGRGGVGRDAFGSWRDASEGSADYGCAPERYYCRRSAGTDGRRGDTFRSGRCAVSDLPGTYHALFHARHGRLHGHLDGRLLLS